MNDEEKMLKVLINLAHIDLDLSKNEIDWLTGFIKRQSFTEVQKDSLFEELRNPSMKYIETFKSIESFFTRGKLIDLSRPLFHIDGKFTKNEKSSYLKLKEVHEQLSGDLIDIQQDAASAMAKDSNDLVFYKEIEELGRVLNNKDNTLGYSIFPSFIFADLFTGGKYAFRFGVLIVLLLLVYYLI